jgi:hypothetical protein
MMMIRRAGLLLILCCACSGRGRLAEYAPEQMVQPNAAFARGEADMIRFVTSDSTIMTLHRARLVRDTVIGTRDAGAARRVPSDSVAYVEAFLPRSSSGVSFGEWFRVGLLAVGLGVMAVCASGSCSP